MTKLDVIIFNQFGIQPPYADATTFADLGADSLDVIEIVHEIDCSLGIDIADDDAERLFAGTVGDLRAVLAKANDNDGPDAPAMAGRASA